MQISVTVITLNEEDHLGRCLESVRGVADEVIVVTDSGKLGRSALARLCGLDVVDRMVVDTDISEEWRGIIEQAGIELIVAAER